MDMFSKGTQSVELSNLPTAGVTKEVGEGSSHVEGGASHLVIAELLGIGMTS